MANFQSKRRTTVQKFARAYNGMCVFISAIHSSSNGNSFSDSWKTLALLISPRPASESQFLCFNKWSSAYRELSGNERIELNGCVVCSLQPCDHLQGKG